MRTDMFFETTNNVQHTDNINTFITTNASFTNKFELFDKQVKEVSNLANTICKDISELNEEQAVQKNRLLEIEGANKNHDVHLKQVDDTLDGIHETLGGLEERYSENKTKLEDVILQSNELPKQVKILEEKITAHGQPV